MMWFIACSLMQKCFNTFAGEYRVDFCGWQDSFLFLLSMCIIFDTIDLNPKIKKI